jgi:type II secretory pathway component PulF
MAVFAYRALDRQQTSVEGAITADSPRGARDQLRARGLVIENLQAQEDVRRTAPGRLFFGGRHAARVASFVRELATLLSVGIPVSEALDTLSGQYRGSFQTAILLVRDQVAAGASTAEALSRQAAIFDDLTVHMVEVGENAGNLEEVLQQLADYQERSLGLKDRVVSALLYPAVTFALAVAVSLFLMTAVVPMLLANLVEAGRTLPWPTRILQMLSRVLVNHGIALAAITILAIAGVALYLRSDAGRLWWHRFLLRLPLLGSMAQKQAVARMAMVLSTLLRSGIVYVKAAQITAASMNNAVFRHALLASCERIESGQDLGLALAESKVFPPLVVHIFTIGQASGKLEDMLDQLADSYDRQVASMANRLASALEPVLILVLVVFVGFILFATLLPILEAGNVM